MTTELNPTRLRAYTRLVHAGMRTIDEVPEQYRVSVYLELIANYAWTIDRVDERYRDVVASQLA